MGVNALPTIWESWMSPTATFPPLIVCLAFTAAADLIEFRVSDCFSCNNPNDEPNNTSWLCQLTLVGCSMLATIFSLLLLISAVLWQSGREDYQTNVWQHLVRFTMVNGTQVLAASHALHTERPVRSLAGSPSDLWEKHYLPSALMTGGILSRDGSTLSTLSNGEWNLFILTPRFYSASVQFRYYPVHVLLSAFLHTVMFLYFWPWNHQGWTFLSIQMGHNGSHDDVSHDDMSHVTWMRAGSYYYFIIIIIIFCKA